MFIRQIPFNIVNTSKCERSLTFPRTSCCFKKCNTPFLFFSTTVNTKRGFSSTATDQNDTEKWLKWMLEMKIKTPQERREVCAKKLLLSGVESVGLSDPDIVQYFDELLQSKKPVYYPTILQYLWSEPNFALKFQFLYKHVFNGAHAPLLWELGTTIFESNPNLKNFMNAQSWFVIANIRTIQDFLCNTMSSNVDSETPEPFYPEVFALASQLSIANTIHSTTPNFEIPEEEITAAVTEVKTSFSQILNQIIKPSLTGSIPLPNPGWVSSNLYPSVMWNGYRKLAVCLHLTNCTSKKELEEKRREDLNTLRADQLVSAIEAMFENDILFDPLDSIETLMEKYYSHCEEMK